MVVIWEPMALTDFECQFRWYVNQMGQSAANKFRNGIFADIALIAKNPMVGREESELNDLFGQQIWRSVISGRRYRIIYCVESQVIRIYMIWACERENKALKRIIIKGK